MFGSADSLPTESKSCWSARPSATSFWRSSNDYRAGKSRIALDLSTAAMSARAAGWSGRRLSTRQMSILDIRRELFEIGSHSSRHPRIPLVR